MLAAPDPPLTDGVVTLRPWQREDIPQLVECLDGDEEIARWLELIPQPYTEKDAREWVDAVASFWRDGTSAPFAVLDADTGRVVGGVGFRWLPDERGVGEVGYWARRNTRGRGVATRATLLLARWVFDELGCERLQLRADDLNVPSQRVAEKAGFHREGTLRSVHYNPRHDRRVDFVMYSLLPSELPR